MFTHTQKTVLIKHDISIYVSYKGKILIHGVENSHIHFGESEFKLKSKLLKNEFISIHQNFERIYIL